MKMMKRRGDRALPCATPVSNDIVAPSSWSTCGVVCEPSDNDAPLVDAFPPLASGFGILTVDLS